MRKSFKYILLSIIYILVTITPIKVNANSISFAKSRTTLGVGYSEVLTYSLDLETEESNIIWESSDEKVAIVDNGKIIAMSEGEAIIRATIEGGEGATCKVIVVSDYTPITSITLNKERTTLLVGAKVTLTTTIKPSHATNKNITWTSSNPSVATVDSSGQVTAHSIGTAIIKASSSSTEAKCEVTVTYSSSLKSIKLNKTNISIKEKATEKLNVIYNPTNATNKKVTWKSNNTNVATVDSSGRVTGIAPGNVEITAMSQEGGYVATCKVTVEEISKKVTSISLDKKEININIGQTNKLIATINPDYAENKNVIWSSSDDKIATVENGIITGISPGIAEIKAISEDGDKEAICKVIVTSLPVEKISFENEEQTVFIGSETTLKMITIPEHTILEKPIWKSSNESVATIENGIVKAISLGETTITVSNENNSLNASMKIIVIEKPKEPLNITVEGYNLNFNKDTKNYTLTIGDESELKINTNIDKKNVSIKGNQNLKNGSIITINITEDTNTTYVINIKKKKNYTIYFIAAISFLLLLNIIRIIIKSKKKPKF